MNTNSNPLPDTPHPDPQASLHDAYAADYDDQVSTYHCHIADLLFGLCYEYIRPGQRLLDAGIGSGLSSHPFARAGLEIYGMDFSSAMLEICRGKGVAKELKQHDLAQFPWPYLSNAFDLLVSCGVFHFLPDLVAIFTEAKRVTIPSGLFAFTTRLPTIPLPLQNPLVRQEIGGFEIYSHSPVYIEGLLLQNSFNILKKQKSFIGEDIYLIWITVKII